MLHTRYAVLVFFTLVVTAESSAQAVLRVAQTYPPLNPGFQQNEPAAPLYEPFVFPMAGGELGLFAQGHCWSCTPSSGDVDALYFFKRRVDGAWVDGRDGTTPIANVNWATPPFYGAAAFSSMTAVNQRQLWDHDLNPATPAVGWAKIRGRQHAGSQGGQFGGPAVVSEGTKLYAAYLKGNSDIYAGEVWWASSLDNGVSWTEMSRPIMYGKYHSSFGPTQYTHYLEWVDRPVECTDGDPGTHCDDPPKNEGFMGVTMAFVNDGGYTWAYLYATYDHPGREINGTTYGTYSYITYRIRIDPNAPHGLSNVRQILLNGSWQPHDGAFAWKDIAGWGSYFPDANYYDSGKLDVIPDTLSGSAPWHDASNRWQVPASITHNGSHFVMLLNSLYGSASNTLKFKISQNAVDWCGPYDLDVSNIGTTLNNALWYGTLGGITGYWGFFSMAGSPSTYYGTKVMPARLEVVGSFPSYCPAFAH